MTNILLLTGFKHFGPYQGNPTEDIVEKFDETSINGYLVKGLILPSNYYKAFEILSKEIDNLSPKALLSIGLATRVPRIRFETTGKNFMNGKYPDDAGFQPHKQEIVPGDKKTYSISTNPIDLAREISNHGISVEISVDAEDYLCNSLLYLTARKLKNEGLNLPYAFFHTPWTNDYIGKVDLKPNKVTIAKSRLEKVVKLTLEYLQRVRDSNPRFLG